MVEPDHPLFPSFCRFEDRFVASSDQAFRNQLRELMRMVTVKRAATMALLRNVYLTYMYLYPSLSFWFGWIINFYFYFYF